MNSVLKPDVYSMQKARETAEAPGHGVQSKVLMWTWEDLDSNLNFVGCWLCDLDTFDLPFLDL